MSHADPDIRRVMRAKKLLEQAKKQIDRLYRPGGGSLEVAHRLREHIHVLKNEIRDRDADWRARQEEKKA